MSRNAMAIVSSLLFALLAVSLVVVPVPYVARRPGQTIDVLGTRDDKPVIGITDATTYPTSGQLLMTTVSTTRVDASLSLPEALVVHVGADSDAMPREVVYPPGKSVEQVESDAIAMMDSSRTDATVAALRAAVIPVTDMPQVDSVSRSGPAADKLKPGDLIKSVNGLEVASQQEVMVILGQHVAGDEVTFMVLCYGCACTIIQLPPTEEDIFNKSIACPLRPRHGPSVVTQWRERCIALQTWKRNGSYT